MLIRRFTSLTLILSLSVDPYYWAPFILIGNWR